MKAVLGHLWYNSGTYFAGSYSAAQLGIDGSQVAQAMPAHGPRPGRSGHACPRSIDLLLAEGTQQNEAWPELSYSASRSERVIWPAK